MRFFNVKTKLFSTYPSFYSSIGEERYSLLFKGELEGNDFPVRIIQEDRVNKYYDLLRVHLFFFITSERTIDLLKNNSVTGWETFPIALFDKNNTLIRGYHGFSVTGRCGEQLLDRAKPRHWRFIANGGEERIFLNYRGYYFDEWDGSDFFLAPNRRVYVSDRVKNIFEDEKISNIEFEEDSDDSVDPYILFNLKYW